MEKQIYFFWGNQSMSFLRYLTIKSFSFHNPEWTINLILDDKKPNTNKWNKSIKEPKQDDEFYNGEDYRLKLFDIPKLNIINIENIVPIELKNIKDICNVQFKDILNWYLLATRTCIVADMDILFCNTLDENELIDWDANVNLSNYDYWKNYIPVSFMVSKVTLDGKNRLYEEIYHNSIKKYNPAVYESCGTNAIGYSSLYAIINKFTDLKIHKMDEDIVFPFAKTNIKQSAAMTFSENNSQMIHKNVVGIHWYGGNPSHSRPYNDKVTADNYMQFDNSVRDIIKKIIN